MDSLELVYKHPLLTGEDLKTLRNGHTKVNYGKGELVLQEGRIADSYLIMASGTMRSYVHSFGGKDITTNFFSENEIVIEASSLFQRIPAQENIEALTDCTCLKIDFAIFQDLFHSIEGFREWGRAWMAQSLFEMKQRSISMITDSATDRYHKLLSDKPLVFRNVPLKHIASYLGITDSSLSRIRKETTKL